jgi:hypothetical protein
MVGVDSLSALVDPTRRRIVELPGRGEHAAGDIVRNLAVSAPAGGLEPRPFWSTRTRLAAEYDSRLAPGRPQ